MKKLASLSGSLAILIIVGLLLWPRFHAPPWEELNAAEAKEKPQAQGP